MRTSGPPVDGRRPWGPAPDGVPTISEGWIYLGSQQQLQQSRSSRGRTWHRPVFDHPDAGRTLRSLLAGWCGRRLRQTRMANVRRPSLPPALVASLGNAQRERDRHRDATGSDALDRARSTPPAHRRLRCSRLSGAGPVARTHGHTPCTLLIRRLQRALYRRSA